MLNGPFSPWPNYDEAEKAAVLSVLDSNKVNYWTGQQCREFEKAFAQYTHCEYAVAVANGTVALDLAWQALDMPKGSEVIVTSRTFIASISSIVLAGLVPVFVDIELDSQNISAETIREKITTNTKAILCVHLAGWPCELDDILALADKHKLFVVEDCAQAHGATYKGKSVGSIGDIGAWSFCQDKIMTTAGEGGMVTTNNKSLWEKIWAFKDHGKSWSAVYEKEHQPGFRWLHESFGTNWRMTEIQGAVGLQQLKKMPTWMQRRQAYATQIFATASKSDALYVPQIPAYIKHAFYKCYVYVRPENLKPEWSRDRIIDAINKLNVPCFSGSCSEVYLEKAFDDSGYRPEEPLVNAVTLGQKSLMFLVHPTLTDDEISRTCQAIEQVMCEAAQS
ncbi:L-glutamine:2-deoxy-scyllo-inosose aminotransferase [Paraglaciecola mesophila KMM 241]|uniref:L-glutamine:2-deoxy-scyllo-inosose aminotransferase n=1 Tax=Paraglaciecola mesophila KMM 241 TaxID=1128912 RepID=K6ZCB7_9ALTE|nr:DegT/DnrJ/EryC1/StrS aminotransferase family protein [Paraglaciecola mesophila]GAC26623.1 L-glutamine:2-deoxy-scyllo-inosose aminotransferase [Paraglaciecola mesophila KMM 241]